MKTTLNGATKWTMQTQDHKTCEKSDKTVDRDRKQIQDQGKPNHKQ